MKTSLLITILAFSSKMLLAQQYAISTIAGGGKIPAAGTTLSETIEVAYGIATSPDGSTYFSSSNAVMKVDSTGTIMRIAGTGIYGISADGDSAASLPLAWPGGLALDNAGNLYIAENAAHRVRKVSSQGAITTVVGTGTPGYSGDGGPALNAQLDWPVGLAIDAAGNLFIADTGNKVIRKVAANGTISTVASGMHYNEGIAVDQAGNVYATDDSYDDDGNQTGYLFKITPSGASTQILGPPTLAVPNGVAVDPSGNIYVADPGNWGLVTLPATGGVQTGSPYANGYVYNVATDNAGNLYESNGGTLLNRISPTGVVTNLTGTGAPGSYWGDGGRATDAALSTPLGVAVDNAGNLYISDSGNNRVRKVAADGTITTFAGSGTPGFAGDGGPAVAAQLSEPYGLALDAAGNLFIADHGNYRVRKVSTDGTITTVAGRGDYKLPVGDGGLATSAALAEPFGVATDANGDLYIADMGFLLVRKVSPNGIISTVAGSDYYQSGPNPVGLPLGVATDKTGDVFITGGEQLFDLSSMGNFLAIAGSSAGGAPTPTGDGGPAVNARMLPGVGVTVDSTGNILISGGSLSGFQGGMSGYVSEITPDGIYHILAGNGAVGYSGDGGPVSQAALSASAGQLAVDASGNIYFADIFNNVVRVLRLVK